MARATSVPAADVVEGAIFQNRPGQRLHTPVNDHLAEVLREPLGDLIPSGEFIDVFDRFEYRLSLAYGDLMAGETLGDTVWVPLGSYRWRRFRDDENFREGPGAAAREADSREWRFLRGPLFGGSPARFLEVKAAVDAYLLGLPIFQGSGQQSGGPLPVSLRAPQATEPRPGQGDRGAAGAA